MKILHKYLKRFVNGMFFEKMTLFMVVFNTIILSFDGLFEDVQTIKNLGVLFYFFNLFFVIEFAVKLLILGPKS